MAPILSYKIGRCQGFLRLYFSISLAGSIKKYNHKRLAQSSNPCIIESLQPRQHHAKHLHNQLLLERQTSFCYPASHKRRSGLRDCTQSKQGLPYLSRYELQSLLIGDTMQHGKFRNALGFGLIVLSVLTFFGIVGGLDHIGPVITWQEWLLFIWFMSGGIVSGLCGIALFNPDRD